MCAVVAWCVRWCVVVVVVVCGCLCRAQGRQPPQGRGRAAREELMLRAIHNTRAVRGRGI